MVQYYQYSMYDAYQNKRTTNSVALVRKQTIPTERLPLIGKVSATFPTKFLKVNPQM
jgi:hypothetical protein